MEVGMEFSSVMDVCTQLTVTVETASGYHGDWQQHTEVIRETEKNIINKGTNILGTKES